MTHTLCLCHSACVFTQIDGEDAHVCTCFAEGNNDGTPAGHLHADDATPKRQRVDVELKSVLRGNENVQTVGRGSVHADAATGKSRASLNRSQQVPVNRNVMHLQREGMMADTMQRGVLS
jgi:hypothetical protein